MSFQQNMLEALKISCKPARAIDGHTYYWYVDNDDARHVRAHFLVENGTTVWSWLAMIRVGFQLFEFSKQPS